MQILWLSDLGYHEIDRFGSTSVAIARLTAGHTSQHVAQLRPGGVIGRHPAVDRQLLMPLQGVVQVSGGDATQTAELSAGEAVVWEPGEMHETRSRDGAIVVVVEGDVTFGSAERL